MKRSFSLIKTVNSGTYETPTQGGRKSTILTVVSRKETILSRESRS